MKINYDSYTVVAEARGQEVLFFEMAGSYQGDWVLLGYKGGIYFLYKDSYGSCSGCDSLQATTLSTLKQAKEFAKDYKPFIKIPESSATMLSKENDLMSVMPKNIRDESWSDIKWPESIEEIQKIILFHQKELVPLSEALTIRNIEVRRSLIEDYGEEKFMDDINATIIDTDGDCKLMKINDFAFLNLKDSSTPRRYMLRVPPVTETVKQGVAWSFDLSPEEYLPIKES